MRNQRQDHELDQLFRKKLGNLDLGPQSHLWENIAEGLEKNKKSSRILVFGWYSRLAVIFTLVSFGSILAYKLSHRNTEAPKIQETNLVDHKSASINSQINSNSEFQKEEKSATQSYDNQDFVKETKHIAFNSESKKGNKKLNQGIYNQPNHQSGLHTFNVENSNIESTSLNENMTSTGVQVSNIQMPIELNNINTLTSSNLISSIKGSHKKKRRDINDDCFSRNISPLNHYDFDIYYAPEISMKSLIARNPTALPYAQKRAGSESFSGANSFGIRASYVNKSGIALRVGLNYCKIKEKFDYFAGVDTTTTVHTGPNGKPVDTTFSYKLKFDTKYNSYKFLDIPILIGYEIDLADFVFSFNGGIGINLSSRSVGQVYASDLMSTLNLGNSSSDINQQGNFRNEIGLSIIGSFGLDYKINRKLMLLAEPTIRYYSNPITTENYPLDQKYMQLGILIGLRYRMY